MGNRDASKRDGGASNRDGGASTRDGRASNRDGRMLKWDMPVLKGDMGNPDAATHPAHAPTLHITDTTGADVVVAARAITIGKETDA